MEYEQIVKIETKWRDDIRDARQRIHDPEGYLGMRDFMGNSRLSRVGRNERFKAEDYYFLKALLEECEPDDVTDLVYWLLALANRRNDGR